MAGTTKLMTPGGGGVNLTPASSIASDVTVNLPSITGTALVSQSSGVTSGFSSTNTFLGNGAGSSVTSGTNNTILGGYNGNNAGLDIRTASNYIVLSDGAGNPNAFCDGSGNWSYGASTAISRITTQSAGSPFAAYTTSGGSTSSIAARVDTVSNNLVSFYYGNWSGVIGYISTNGTTVSYVTSSDYRLKEDVQPMQNALATVAQLNPVTYKWKSDGSDGQGFIAHELQAVVPDCVVGEKDAVDAEGNPKYQGIDTSFLVATLTAAIKELSAKNDALEARLSALEAK